MSTGLLLGAGFSADLGMPVGKTLTTEITTVLSPERLRKLDERWARSGRGLTEHVERLCQFMALPHVTNYESVLGHLESEDWLIRARTDRAPNTLKRIFIDLISSLLTGRQIVLVGLTLEMLRFYDGLLGLATANTPLWVFTLNHDVMLELVAARLRLPISSGFSDEKISIKCNPSPTGEPCSVDAEVIRNTHLKSRKLQFHRQGTTGINLLKIHGALDIFTFNDGNDVLRILPHGERPDGIVHALYNLNSQLPRVPGPRIVGEIRANDTAGNEMMLQRSLVSGAHKFDERHPQVLPFDYLQIFGSSLLHLDTLICIGYGFLDAHINNQIKGWLELSRDKRLVIVGPGCAVPPLFLHLSDRIECKNMGATQFLQENAEPLSSEDMAVYERNRAALDGINNHPINATAWLTWNEPELWHT